MTVEQEIDLLTGVEGSFTNDESKADGPDVTQGDEQEDGPSAPAEPLPAGMSLVGLGVDIVEISRMEDILERTPSFKQRVFTEEERAYCESKHNPAVHYALFFAAKEAVLKALGTGFRGMGINDVQVGHNRYGRPLAILAGNAARVAEEQGIHEVHLSLSYTHTTGVASAVAARKEDIPEQKRADEAQIALDQQFKSMRAMLEDIDAKLTEIESTARAGSQEAGAVEDKPEEDEIQ
jgi:holo-[acyl-carrier protein] synthase